MNNFTVPAQSRRDRALELVLKLRENQLFENLTAEELMPVASIATKRPFEGGVTLFERGDDGEHFYLIAKGKVEVAVGSRRIAVLGPDECFGEMAILERAPRSASVRTLEPVECLTIAYEDFHDLLDMYPAIARGIALVLAERVRDRLG